jgi:bifunctional non-homologous end joining protein LigD|tara:strand:+ start:14382 stop:16835 length:2454 start_codon:yes stop_codon:yes gene_type:complete
VAKRKARNASPPDPATLLADYNAKRDFKKTAEPKGEGGAGSGRTFMVQKHDATRLHYDLRLEKDGVLKSWAVTKGPSLNPDDKRLAVQTEDHPLSYATFEGTIPKAEYGGGTVMLWDRGTWEPIEGKSAADLEEGHLHFRLDGERMKGEWLLIRMKRREGEKRDNWLLRKIDDAEAGASGGLTEAYLTSVETGRTMEEIAAGKSQRKTRKKGVKTAALPAFSAPQLATLSDSVPSGSDWLHEMKYDGYRALIAARGEDVRIFTRSGKDWTERFPAVAQAVAAAGFGSVLIDGEIAVLDKDGRPDFGSLQSSFDNKGKGQILFAFDLLESDGEDLRGLTNIERKQKLASLLPPGDKVIRYSDHVVGKGEALFDAMCAKGLEGVICKKANAPYRNQRTRNWLKVKCIRRQEFVIIGRSPSSKKGRDFASLLLAQNEGGKLVYRGKVGTGFDEDTMSTLARKLDGLSRKAPPAEVPKVAARGAVWATPKLVAEVAFAEFTGEGVLRHASFIGLREDKPPEEVVTERAVAAPTEAVEVAISSPDRVIFPDAGITKGELADYYRNAAPLMLPWAARRPISLVRCPGGRAKQCFFQKHDPGSFGEHVLGVAIREKDGGTEDYLYVEDEAGLLACVQMGTIEFHGWGARVGDVERPDRMVFDLDPDEGLDFADVRQAALDIRAHLADTGLESFAMLSGGKGVHVVVPLKPDAEWPAVKDFASRFSRALAAAEPERFTATMSKAKRKGRIFIDWLRNQRGATAILPYAVRARENAPVAAPVSWAELPKMDSGAVFTVATFDRLRRRAGGAALAGWGEADQVLPSL